MKTYDFINQSIGQKVYLVNKGDIAFDSEYKSLIYNKVPLTLLKLTKKGMAYTVDGAGNFHSVPPSCLREFDESKQEVLKYCDKLNEKNRGTAFGMAKCSECGKPFVLAYHIKSGSFLNVIPNMCGEDEREKLGLNDGDYRGF